MSDSKPHIKLYPTVNPAPTEALGGAYEGASRTNNELALWGPSNTPANAEVMSGKRTSDARVKDLARNEGYVAGAIDFHKDNIVGSQYTLNAKPNLKVLQAVNSKFDDKWAEDFQESVEARFTLWGESPNCHPDAAGMNTFTDHIRLAVGLGVMTGEVLASAEYIATPSNPYRTCISMIDVDRLGNPYDMLDAKDVVGGVKVNRHGRPLGHYISQVNPADTLGMEVYPPKFYPVRQRVTGRKNIIHIFEQNRASQNRAVSQMVSVLKKMAMTRKYSDVVLQNAVINASYAATIESELPPETTYNQLSGGSSTASQDYMNQVAAYMGSSNNIHIDGVKVPHLWPGQKLTLKNAGSPGGVGDNFEQSLLRNVASGLGLSYEQFARDYTQTNYSSARASAGETKKHMMARKRLFADRFASEIYQLWFEEDFMNGNVPLPKGVSLMGFYSGQFKDAITQCSWIGAGGSEIDPLKETKAAILKVKYNLSTYEAECAKLGTDYRDVIAQRKREEAMNPIINDDKIEEASVS